MVNQEEGSGQRKRRHQGQREQQGPGDDLPAAEAPRENTTFSVAKVAHQDGRDHGKVAAQRTGAAVDQGEASDCRRPEAPRCAVASGRWRVPTRPCWLIMAPPAARWPCAACWPGALPGRGLDVPPEQLLHPRPAGQPSREANPMSHYDADFCRHLLKCPRRAGGFYNGIPSAGAAGMRAIIVPVLLPTRDELRPLCPLTFRGSLFPFELPISR
jgi:hypothetical protein